MSTHKLYNRYGDNIYIEQTNDPSKYYLKGDLEYMRVIFDDSNGEKIIQAIDPSGGPYMAIDHFELIDNGSVKKLKSIYEEIVGNNFNWVLEFEN